jgi:hypothetical protein
MVDHVVNDMICEPGQGHPYKKVSICQQRVGGVEPPNGAKDAFAEKMRIENWQPKGGSLERNALVHRFVENRRGAQAAIERFQDRSAGDNLDLRVHGEDARYLLQSPWLEAVVAVEKTDDLSSRSRDALIEGVIGTAVRLPNMLDTLVPRNDLRGQGVRSTVNNYMLEKGVSPAVEAFYGLREQPASVKSGRNDADGAS